MRLTVLAAVVALAFATSALAVQKPNRGQCRRIANQLEQHAQSVEQAEERGNALWARSTLQQMERLDRRRARLCPDLYPESASERAMAELRRMIKIAGKAALSFFTMGAM